MNNEIELFKHPITDPKILTNPDDLEAILEAVREVGNTVYDLSTMQGVEDLKDMKKVASKWVKALAKKCEPLEEEGKKVMKARSSITTTLLTGKESVIANMLNPILEAEKKLDYINIMVVTPIPDIDSCDMIISKANELESFNWLAYKKQSEMLLNQLRVGAGIRKKELEIVAKAEQDKLDKEREERERLIAKEAAERAVIETEQRIKREQENVERERKIVKESNPTNFTPSTKAIDKNIEHQKKIHNEILNALLELPSPLEQGMVDAKDIIKAIANNKIPHLTINY